MMFVVQEDYVSTPPVWLSCGNFVNMDVEQHLPFYCHVAYEQFATCYAKETDSEPMCTVYSLLLHSVPKGWKLV